MLLKPEAWDGTPIVRPGVYSGVPSSSYHGKLTAKHSVSNSGLKVVFDDSPAHFFEGSYLNPANWKKVIVDGVPTLQLIEKPASEPLVFGRASHHALLGEADFKEHFVIRPEKYRDEDGKLKPWSGSATVCKETLADYKARRLTVITAAQLEHIKGMAKSMGQHPMIREGILGGLIEHSMVAEDAETGIMLKTRPDSIPTDSGDYADLKSIADITDSGIEKAIGDNNYQMQGALVGMVHRLLTGQDMTSFTLVFVEKAPPYCVRIHTLTGEDLELGERQIRIALDTMARCFETGRWFGPGGDQKDASFATMNPWRRRAIEQRIKIMEGDLTL